MDFENPHVVYVKYNGSNYITAVNSSAFLADTTDWIEIDRGYGDKYHHAQGNYFEKPIYTDSGVYRYRLASGKPVECSDAEIAEQEAALEPAGPAPGSLEERVNAVESDVASLTAAIEKGLGL